MRCCTFWALLGVITFALPGRSAADMIGLAEEDLTLTIKVPAGGTKTSFHLDFTNDSGFFVYCDATITGQDDQKPPDTLSGKGTHPGDDFGKGSVDLQQQGTKGLKTGSNFTVTICTLSPFNGFNIVQAYFDTKTGPDAPIKGLKFKAQAGPVGDPQTFLSLTNTTNDYLTFSNLTYLFDSPALPEDAPVRSIAGFTPLAGMLTLAPNTAAPDFLFPALDAGQFLYMESDVYPSDANGVATGDSFGVRFGHQAAPEPSALLLSVLGSLALAWYVRRRGVSL